MTIDMPPRGATWEQRGGWIVCALMRDLDLAIGTAAGFTGNPGYESNGLTALQETHPQAAGSKGGAGWCQWTGYNPPNDRRAQFEKWCADHNLSATSDEGNYGYMLDELRGRFKTFTLRLKLCETVEDACRLTHRLYETPSDILDGSYRSLPDRVKWANRALDGAKAMLAGGVVSRPAAPVVPENAEITAEDDPDLMADIMRAAQRVLRATGDYKGPLDGKFGVASKAAYDQFVGRMK